MDYLTLSLAISPMNMMWISFYSIGFMMIAMFLIHLSRTKISNGVVSVVVSLMAYGFLVLGGLTMIFVIFYW